MSSQDPVFVDFWASWCGPCRITSPLVEELAKDNSDKVKFVKVNVDDNANLASKYNVYSIPTFLLLNKGRVIAQLIGARSKSSYQEMIQNGLAKVSGN